VFHSNPALGEKRNAATDVAALAASILFAAGDIVQS
jgi:hypothetical protein